MRIEQIRATFGQFSKDQRGVAAIEFAFMIPILLCLYFGSLEIMQAIDTSRKLDRASAQIADLVSQNVNSSKADLDAIIDIGAAILRPYDRSTPNIRVTAVKMSNENSPKATVLWKRNKVNGVSSGAGSSSEAVDVPETFKVKGQILIKVEMDLDYNLIMTWDGKSASKYGVAGFFNGVPMKDTYYFRPRIGDTVNCSDCSS